MTGIQSQTQMQNCTSAMTNPKAAVTLGEQNWSLLNSAIPTVFSYGLLHGLHISYCTYTHTPHSGSALHVQHLVNQPTDSSSKTLDIS